MTSLTLCYMALVKASDQPIRFEHTYSGNLTLKTTI